MEWRRRHVWFILVVLIAVISVSIYTEMSPRTQRLRRDGSGECLDCNVIFVSIETLRADHMSIYGYERQTTHNLERFFEDKTVFDNAMSPSPCTRPAVLQYLTGKFKHGNGRDKLPEVLRKAGYYTAAVVSQHHFGFKEKPNREYSEGFDYFDVQSKDKINQHNLTNRTAKELTDNAINWLENRRDNGKFFLWLHYFDPHDPYEPPEEFRLAQYNGKSDRTGDVRTYLRKGSGKNEHWTKAGRIFNRGDIQHFISLYDGEIAYIDSEVGRLLDKIDELGLVENSIIIVISDHGERLGEDNLWDHCHTLHEVEIHVPFLVSVRGRRLGDYGRYAGSVSTLDVYPTVLSLLNVTYQPDELDGVDLMGQEAGRKVYSGWKSDKIVLFDGWKLYYNKSEGPTQLYNIESDVYEKDNRIDEEVEVAEKLAGYMEDFIYSERHDEKRDEEIVEELKALNYI
jgi:arylsulfatase A-like enzyme